ncbi:MAG TPA: methylthioribulose 1-phosphate dehydratase [bacterium]|nr:methylthioribulose 1-phosphate dehydratase [bacterium]
MDKTEPFQQAAQAMIEAGKFLFASGWSSATSSNYSTRLDDELIAITVSGKHKGRLTSDDIMLVDLAGRPVATDKKPSAETMLHTSLYARDRSIGAVLHTHSVHATVLSRLSAPNPLRIRDYEMQKAFSGITTHACEICIPIFDNTQNIAALAAEVENYLQNHENVFAYLIKGHGLYTWGQTMEDALRHVEALEFLFSCELTSRSLQR